MSEDTPIYAVGHEIEVDGEFREYIGDCIDTPLTDQEHVIHGATTMLGDLMSCVLDLAKALPKAWQQLSQSEQAMWLSLVDQRVQQAIQQCVAIIATREVQQIHAIVDSVTFKKGVKVTLKMPKTTPGAHLVADYAGEDVFIVVTNTSELLSDNNKPTAAKDQPDLVLTEGAKAGA